MTIFCGLIRGRHSLPGTVTDYIFCGDVPQEHICDSAYMERVCVDFLNTHAADHIKVYVTGFTPALLALIKVCVARGIRVTAFNYDRENRRFWEQEVI